MKPKNFHKKLDYLNGDTHIPNNKNIIFLFDSRNRELKTSNSNCRRFFNNMNTVRLTLFLRKVNCMRISIDMKSDIAFVAINNSPCSIQEGSTKDDRHVVILGPIKYKSLLE